MGWGRKWAWRKRRRKKRVGKCSHVLPALKKNEALHLTGEARGDESKGY